MCRAANRAKRLTEVHNEGLCIAIEGGVSDCISGTGALECFAWCVVVDPATGRKGQARSASFKLPDQIAALVQQGVELGEAGMTNRASPVLCRAVLQVRSILYRISSWTCRSK